MKNKFLKIVAVVFVLSTVSCEDWLDVNDSPNTPLINQIPPQLLLSAAQTETYKMISGDTENTSADISTGNLNQLGNIFMNSWAGNSNNTTGAYANEYSVSLTASFYDNIWDYGYRNINNLDNLANYESENYDNHKAIAMILKSFYMQYIVDLYGDCPYSQAFLGTAEPTPAYDDDQAIYRALVDQIDAAIAKIHAADANDATVSGEDVMFAGDMIKWEKFANTVKLRLLIRQSTLAETDAATATYINDELVELEGALYMDENVIINPGYNSSTTDQQNPFYASYGFTITGGGTGQRAFVTASRFAANALNGTATGVVDPRRGRLFVLQGGAVVGINQGEDADTAPDNVSFIGPALCPDPTRPSPQTPDPVVIAAGSSLNSYVMTLSEIDFLLAEAAFRFPGHDFGDTDQNYFNAGISASMTRLGVTPANAALYLGDIDSAPGFGWNASTNKIEAIMTQKWIALMHVNGGESWIDQVRTGFPVVPLALTNTTGKPKRLMYPTSEYTGNTGNLPAQTAAQAFATGPFWLP